MREIVRGATTAFVVKGLSALLLFASQVVIARVLGPADAGLYFLAFTVMTIAAMLGRVGLDNTVLRFVAGLSATEEWPAVRGVYRRAIAVGLAASGATALLLGLAAPSAAGAVFGKPELAGPLLWMALGVVPTALFTLQAQALQGLKRLGESNLIGGVVTPALLCVGVLLLGARWGALGPAWAYVAAALLTAAAGAYLWRRAMASHPGPRRAFPLPTLLESSVPLFWVSVFQLVITWTSTVALGILGTTTDVAIFGAANRTAALTSFVLLAVNSISAPKFAALHRAGDLATMGSIARKSARLMAILASPVLALFVLAPGPVLRLFGDEFVVGAPVLTILALGQFVNVVTCAPCSPS
jgi:O-antigen/teichoic acid export membrane protein